MKLDKIEKLGYMNVLFPLLLLVRSTVYRLNVLIPQMSPRKTLKKIIKLQKLQSAFV